MSHILLGLAIAGLLVALLWLFGSGEATDVPRDSDVDSELLEAEEEVQDLDAFSTPEDADDDLPDWGPGVPRTP